MNMQIFLLDTHFINENCLFLLTIGPGLAFKLFCDVTNHSHRFTHQIFTEHRKCPHFEQWMWNQPHSVRFCRCIFPHSEAPTFSRRSKKKHTRLTERGEFKPADLPCVKTSLQSKPRDGTAAFRCLHTGKIFIMSAWHWCRDRNKTFCL